MKERKKIIYKSEGDNEANHSHGVLVPPEDLACQNKCQAA